VKQEVARARLPPRANGRREETPHRPRSARPWRAQPASADQRLLLLLLFEELLLLELPELLLLLFEELLLLELLLLLLELFEELLLLELLA
jgi:hypothetical protein